LRLDKSNSDIFQIRYNNASKMILDTSGNVGINTTAPVATLHVNDIGSEGPSVFIEGGSSTEGDITYPTDETLQFGTWDRTTNTYNHYMGLSGSGQVYMTGELSVGLASSDGPYTSGERQISAYAGAEGNNSQVSARNVADGSPVWRSQVGGTTKSEIEANGDFQSATSSYGGTSDQTLKENIIESGSQWDDIKAVQVKKYSYISDELDAPNMIGVIAQDLEAAGMGGLVGSMDKGDGTMVKTVKYSILYMKAIKALQEAMDKIETLEAKVAALENN